MQDALALGTLLDRIGAELADRAGDAEALGELVPLLPALDGPLQARAQSIDRLAQELGELARLLGSLAHQAPGATVPADLVDALRLSDLAARLRGGGSDPDQAGELDLF